MRVSRGMKAWINSRTGTLFWYRTENRLFMFLEIAVCIKFSTDYKWNIWVYVALVFRKGFQFLGTFYVSRVTYTNPIVSSLKGRKKRNPSWKVCKKSLVEVVFDFPNTGRHIFVVKWWQIEWGIEMWHDRYIWTVLYPIEADRSRNRIEVYKNYF